MNMNIDFFGKAREFDNVLLFWYIEDTCFSAYFYPSGVISSVSKRAIPHVLIRSPRPPPHQTHIFSRVVSSMDTTHELNTAVPLFKAPFFS